MFLGVFRVLLGVPRCFQGVFRVFLGVFRVLLGVPRCFYVFLGCF